ncbi:hypothetical protein LCGC14_3086890 [marine sediment metagenome]|uniref:Uncharacterized protein n=1 Tax=marine sediment metagenome TaxID=412755 RepID=A0A0F8WCB0_9ZZZZ
MTTTRSMSWLKDSATFIAADKLAVAAQRFKRFLEPSAAARLTGGVHWAGTVSSRDEALPWKDADGSVGRGVIGLVEIAGADEREFLCWIGR